MDVSKYFPCEEMKNDFEAYKTLNSVNEKKVFQKRRIERFEKMSDEEKTAYCENKHMSLKAIEKRVDELHEIVKLGEVAKLLSLAYVSEKYFGKTRQWLYQRLKGALVNGKPARFTNEEKIKFRQALQDISNLIGKTSLKIV
jgi:hypothetical protein